MLSQDICLLCFPQAEQEMKANERDGATYSSSAEESSNEGDSSDDPAGDSVEDGRSVEYGAAGDNMDKDASSELEDTVKVCTCNSYMHGVLLALD